MSNGIKFTSSGGVVSVHLHVKKVEDVPKEVVGSEESYESAPDKDVVVSSNEKYIEKSNLKEKIISYTITFRDSGCGISI